MLNFDQVATGIRLKTSKKMEEIRIYWFKIMNFFVFRSKKLLIVLSVINNVIYKIFVVYEKGTIYVYYYLSII